MEKARKGKKKRKGCKCHRKDGKFENWVREERPYQISMYTKIRRCKKTRYQ